MRQYAAYYKGQPIFGPRGPSGPDGNPIGTIISYMGLTAPQDYLVCDGTAYNIIDYPDLAAFFTKQFGSANHFGGDGEATFAVPDLRNLFLRGFRGGAEEQLSGDIGAKQEATQIPNIYIAAYGGGFFVGKNPALDGNWPAYTDKQGPAQSTYSQISATVHTGNVMEYYTTRPVNMAVLYCIKAVESVPAENVYSAEETRIGTWTDGKPLYRRVYNGISGNGETYITVGEIENLDKTVDMYGVIGHRSISGMVSIPDTNVEPQVVGSTFRLYIGIEALQRQQFTLIVEYTKTTD